MKIILKTERDLDAMRPACAVASRVLEEVSAFIRPGVTTQQIRTAAKAAMEPVFARTKFSKPIYEKAARNLVNGGGGVLSHPVGMAVHHR